MHEARITRQNPALVFIMWDCSQSMTQAFGRSGRRKCDGVADAINELLAEMAVRCAKGEDVRDYFEVGLLAYGGDDVGFAWAGELEGGAILPISRIASSPLRVETRSSTGDAADGESADETHCYPVWVEPRATGATPMAEAFELACQHVSEWVANHPESFPPTCVHLTDGMPTDGDPRGHMAYLRGIETSDGPIILTNIGLSSEETEILAYPSDLGALSDAYAAMLFNNSSRLPERMSAMAQERGFDVDADARAFLLNVHDASTLISALNIGTPTL